MLDTHEAAKKIAAASHCLRQAKEAQRTAADDPIVRAAQRRLAVLLRLFIGFKDDPSFKVAYQHELQELNRRSVSRPSVAVRSR